MKTEEYAELPAPGHPSIDVAKEVIFIQVILQAKLIEESIEAWDSQSSETLLKFAGKTMYVGHDGQVTPNPNPTGCLAILHLHRYIRDAFGARRPRSNFQGESVMWGGYPSQIGIANIGGIGTIPTLVFQRGYGCKKLLNACR